MPGLGKPAEPLGDANGTRPTAWIGDRQLSCLVCDGRLFAYRQVLLNTAGMTYVGLDWLNRAAVGVVCRECGFVHEFMGDRVTWRPEESAD
ncbi:hypothetical protein [Nocardioides mangrovi]|uniref:DNA-binding protein n=1 Tax=Nocardioides mangrovi TaxID=2874580 RepID=A0ABS7UJD7_9ACTN|nr:hypothetical protein [Nocardioides mangrovi]MBZ5741139.1 hypothetical protein [Nocardioides mangrovi]